MADNIDKVRRFHGYHVAKVLPAAYSDELSYYELLSKMQRYCNDLAAKINEILDHDESVVAELESIKADIDERVRELYAHLDQFLEQFEDSSVDWDCQHGYMTNTVEAMRDMFRDVTVHSITVKQLRERNMTVADLSECGLSVRGLAVWGSTCLTHSTLTPSSSPTIPEPAALTLIASTMRRLTATDMFTYRREVSDADNDQLQPSAL